MVVCIRLYDERAIHLRTKLQARIVQTIVCIPWMLIVIWGNLRLSGRTRAVRQIREWIDTRDGSSRRFPSPWPPPSGKGNGGHRAVESRRDWIVIRGENGSPSPQGRGLGERNH